MQSPPTTWNWEYGFSKFGCSIHLTVPLSHYQKLTVQFPHLLWGKQWQKKKPAAISFRKSKSHLSSSNVVYGFFCLIVMLCTSQHPSNTELHNHWLIYDIQSLKESSKISIDNSNIVSLEKDKNYLQGISINRWGRNRQHTSDCLQLTTETVALFSLEQVLISWVSIWDWHMLNSRDIFIWPQLHTAAVWSVMGSGLFFCAILYPPSIPLYKMKTSGVCLCTHC